MALVGVIDRFEENYAVIILDDEQQLDWPRERLSPSVNAGDTVSISIDPAPTQSKAASTSTESNWSGQQTGAMVTLEDGQTLQLDAAAATTATKKAPVVLTITVDQEETEARKKRIGSLLDDIFKKP